MARSDKIAPKQTLTKVCGVAYEFSDIEKIVEFCKTYDYAYYYIKHIPDDEETKEHYHFIIESNYTKRFRIMSLLSDTFKENLFKPLKNVNSYLRYMTHCDYDFKTKYSSDEIISNIDTFTIEDMIQQANPNKLDMKEVKANEFYSVVSAIEDYNLTSISSIMAYCIENHIIYDLHWTYTLNTIINEKKRYIVNNEEKPKVFKN